MVSVLYVASINPRDGKTVLSAGLARRWQQAGLRVDYLKPITVSASPDRSSRPDDEFIFARLALGLQEPSQIDAPMTVSADTLDDTSLAEVQSTVESLCHKASEEADVLLVEAPGGLGSDSPGKLVSPTISAAAQARVLLVVRYTRSLDKEEVISAAMLFGEALLGVVVNSVSQLSWRLASTSFAPSLTDAGLRVLGLIPETRTMLSISVQDLVERLNGRYVTKANGSDDLIENVMVGANLMDAPGYPAGLEYFGRKKNKAVIAKGDRPDFQWAAMDTPTSCIILTGNYEPIPYVIEKAKETGIPLVVVEKDTLDTLHALEEILAVPRFDQVKKLERFQSLVEENLDLPALDAALGI